VNAGDHLIVMGSQEKLRALELLVSDPRPTRR
jgi:hypothetical protein